MYYVLDREFSLGIVDCLSLYLPLSDVTLKYGKHVLIA